MSGTEWEDDDDSDYPSAPVPPHERVWRHPSELGSPVVVTRPTFGRSYFIGAGVVGMVLVVGLIQLLLPRAGTSVVSTQATQATQGLGGRSTPSEPLPSFATPPTNLVSTMMLLGSRRAAVPVGDGYQAVTTAESLAEDDTIDVQLADGTAVAALVVIVDQRANVAVIRLERPVQGAPPAVSDVEPHDGDTVYVGCQNPDDAVLVATESGMVVEMNASPDEGAPVLNEDGDLVGLASTGDDGVVHLVPITEEMAASAGGDGQLLVIDVWLGITFQGDDLAIDQVQSGAPAELAGVQVGDRLLAIADVATAVIDDVWTVLSRYHPGDIVTLLVDRLGDQLERVVTLGARPS